VNLVAAFSGKIDTFFGRHSFKKSRLFRAVLTYTNGNQSEAAEILGINRGTLRKKLKDYKLQGR
jgi:DNA-binding NtrC family response regulator